MLNIVVKVHIGCGLNILPPVFKQIKVLGNYKYTLTKNYITGTSTT